MEIKFVAQQRALGLSECERLCGRRSVEIAELAARAGWCGMPGEPVSVAVGAALNMSVLSIAKRHGVELQYMVACLPGLREGALLELGMDTSNWSFEGSYEAEQKFWPILYGGRDAVRPRIARLLGCYSNSPTWQLRFFSRATSSNSPIMSSSRVVLTERQGSRSTRMISPSRLKPTVDRRCSPLDR